MIYDFLGSGFAKNPIEDAFLNIYKAKPLDKIRVTDLCGALNISRSTFYSRYEGVYSLYYSCEQNALETLRSLLATVLSFPGLFSTCASYKMIYRSFLNRLKENRHLYAVFLSGSEKDSFFKACHSKLYSSFLVTLDDKGCKNKEEAAVLADMFASSRVHIISKWLLDDCAVSVDIMVNTLASLLFDGIYSYVENKENA